MIVTSKQEAKEEIKRIVPCTQFLQKSPRGKGYICIFCGSGSGKNQTGAMDFYPPENTVYCHKCNNNDTYKQADCIDVYMQTHGIDDFNDALTQLMDENNIILASDAGTKKNDVTERPQSHETAEPDKSIAETDKTAKNGNNGVTDAPADYMEYYKACKSHITDTPALEYLKSRGIDQDTAAAYWIGYDPATKFIIIPCSKYFYVARNTNTASNFRYNNPAGVPVELFNQKALYDSTGPVFITEGLFNALTIIEAGGNAVALNSAGNYRKLLTALKEKPTDNALIICLDNDPTGEKDTESLTAGLKELKAQDNININYIVANIAGDCNDVNDAWIKDADAVRDAVENAQRKALRPDNTADYIRQEMYNEIREMRLDARRKTGFANIDLQMHCLYSGLYVIGGISSVGKTSWTWQLADQLAEQGEHVLFFSLEMSKLEMISKSISRFTAILDKKNAVSGAQIRMGAAGELIDRATREYIRRVGNRVSVIEGNFDYNIYSVGDYIENYIKQNKVRPTVILDYLQILPAAADAETGRKQTDPRIITNDNIVYLKRLSRQYKIPVIVTSALNRQNYTAPIDFESFRESSGIEYSADFVAGLQLAVFDDNVFNTDNTVDKRDRIKAAKAANPRQIEFVCLKNRWGKSSFRCLFEYRPQYDYFEIPKEEMPTDKDIEQARSEWKYLDAGEQMNLPFD